MRQLNAPQSVCTGLRPRTQIRTHASPLRAVLVAATLLLPATATAQVRTKNKLPPYSVEVEPHLVLQLFNEPAHADEGFGPGVRLSIPIIEQGPIRTIDNNMALGFGFDLTFFDDCHDRYWYDRYWGWAENCEATDWWFPVVWQWNFVFTPVVSVLAEAGLAIDHERISWEGPCAPNSPELCDYDDTDTHLRVVVAGGGRFMVADTVGITLRLGTPYISAGVSLLL
jgi:hypothetical protein